MHLDYTKVIILILWWRNFQLEYWRTFQLVSTLAAVLDNPDAIQRIKEPTEKVQIAAVQKKPELVRLFTNTTEKVQLSAVIASPESVLLMQAPSPLACFTAVERMFKADLPPTTGILAAARRLVFRMKGNKKLGEPDTEAVKEFFDEVKSFKY